MNREEELLLHDYLVTLQRLSHYPIVLQDANSGDFVVKAGGTKQGVYANMVFIRNITDYILKHFFDEEAEDGIE